MKGNSGRIVALALLAGCVWAPPALAQTASDPNAPCGLPDGKVISVPTPKDVGRLPADRPALAWIGTPADQGVGDQPEAWPAEVLARLKLAPGSVVSGIAVSGKGSLAGWAAPGVRFLGVSFAGTSLAGANLAGACFDHGTITRADLSGANLAGARFESTDVSGARFDRADLSGAALRCAVGIVGEGCDGFEEQTALGLRDANLQRADLAGPVEVFGAVLDGARVDQTSLPLTPEALEALAKARVAAVRLTPPFLREGKGDVFSADELARLRQLAGGNPMTLLLELANTPSFDCKLAGLSVVEKAICEPGDLPSLDRLMAATYRRSLEAAADKAAVKAGQTAFLKARNACAAVAEDARFTCIANAYTARLAELGRGFAKAVAAAGSRTLYGAPLAVKPAMAAEPLTARILRAFGTSPDTAVLEAKGGAIAIHAETVGGNGHACSFEAPLRYDSARGLWVGDIEGDKMAWVVLPDGVAVASTPEEARMFCGMRASWPGVFFPAD